MRSDLMNATFSSDMFKLRKLKSVWIGLILMFAIAFIGYGVYWIGLNVLENNPAIGDVPVLPEQIEAYRQLGNELLYGFTTSTDMVLLVAIIIGIFIGKDFSNGTVRLSVSRGANRLQVYFSKLASIIILIVFYALFSLVLCGIFTAIGGYNGAFTGANFGVLMGDLALQLLAQISCASIFVMIAFLCRSSGSSISAIIGSYILLSFVFSLIAPFGALSGGDQLWVQFMPFQQINIAASSTLPQKAELAAAIAMPIVYTAISTFVGAYTFVKRDIK